MAKVSFVDKLFFTKHLAIMVKSGITLSEAVDSLATESRSKGLGTVLRAIHSQIMAGEAFSKALQRHPKVFDTFYVYMVKVGEESGALEQNLEYLATQLEKEYSLQKKVKGALMYPVLVFVAASVMGFFIALFLLPQLVDLFAALDVKLPLSTRILLYVAVGFKNYGILIGAFFVGFVFLVSYLKTLPFINPTWHRLLIKIPIFGSLVRSSNVARITRNLGILLKSGLPVLTSVETTSHTVENVVYRRSLEAIYEEVKKGHEMSKAMSPLTSTMFFISTPLYPQLVVKMIAVGEKTGKLEESLLYLSDFYEAEIDDFSKNLTTILEPVLLLGVGLIVGFIAIAIIGPIYDLTGSLGK